MWTSTLYPTQSLRRVGLFVAGCIPCPSINALCAAAVFACREFGVVLCISPKALRRAGFFVAGCIPCPSINALCAAVL